MFDCAVAIGLGLCSWNETMKTGDLFIKHHKWTAPKLRSVWLSEGLDKVFWGDPNTISAHKGYILARDIMEVCDGILKGRKIDDPSRSLCTFTVVTKHRTLELEAQTRETKERWTTYFRSLMEHTATRTESTVSRTSVESAPEK